MFPIDKIDQTKIVEWQCWGYGLGAEDLANMLAMRWYPSQRQMQEKKLLKRYHGKLLENGINTYSFDDL